MGDCDIKNPQLHQALGKLKMKHQNQIWNFVDSLIKDTTKTSHFCCHLSIILSFILALFLMVGFQPQGQKIQHCFITSNRTYVLYSCSDQVIATVSP